MASIVGDAGFECVWFDLGMLRAYTFSAREAQDARLPYERCAICGLDSVRDRFLVIAHQVANDAILLSGWALRPSQWTRTPLFAIYPGTNGWEVAQVEGEEIPTRERCAPLVGILASFLRLVNPVGYRATEKPRSLTNLRRAMKGKPALIYDWHTVEIAPPQDKREPLGGHHASPRQHQRRGHWRTCAGGSRVWVRHCIVGDPARGWVGKDYQVAEAEKA
jgi:hypothetical protein